MELESILSSKAVSENLARVGRNFKKIEDSISGNAIQTQTILESYLSAHNISPIAKRGKLDIKLKGDSLNNLYGYSDLIKKYSTYCSLDTNGDLAVVNVKYFADSRDKIDISAYAGKKVTLAGKVKYSLQGKSYIAFTKADNSGVYTVYGESVQADTWVDIPKQVVTVPENAKWFTVTGYFNENIATVTIRDFYLYEGDLTDKYTNYIDGLQGASNIRVLSTGKNLFDGNFQVGDLAWQGNEIEANDRIRSINYIRVEPNTVYTISGGTESGFQLNSYNSNKSAIPWVNTNGISVNNNGTFTTPDNCYYIRIVTRGTTNTEIKVQIEEGTTATEYEPYKSTQTTYKTLDGQPITLHGLQNGVYDEKLIDGRCVKRIGEKTLVASDITLEYSSASIYIAKIIKPSDCVNFVDAVQNVVIVPDRPEVQSITYSTITSSYIGTFATDSAQKLLFYFDPSTTLTAAQTALAGTKIIYELAQPRILETNAVPLIAEPNGHVFISSDGCIPSNELSYPLNLGAVVDGLIDGQKENSNLLDKFGNQINNLVENGGSNKLLENNTDLNTLIIPGFYRIGINAAQGDVPAGTYFMIINRQSTIITQMFIVVNSNFTTAGEILTRISGDSGANWTAIKKMVTTTPNDWITATLQNGWTGTLQYRKNQIGQLEVIGNNLTAGTVTLNTLVSNLPSGYRPIGYTVISAFDAVTGKNINAPLALDSNGSVRLLADGLSSSLRLYFDIVCA